MAGGAALILDCSFSFLRCRELTHDPTGVDYRVVTWGWFWVPQPLVCKGAVLRFLDMRNNLVWICRHATRRRLVEDGLGLKSKSNMDGRKRRPSQEPR